MHQLSFVSNGLRGFCGIMHAHKDRNAYIMSAEAICSYPHVPLSTCVCLVHALIFHCLLLLSTSCKWCTCTCKHVHVCMYISPHTYSHELFALLALRIFCMLPCVHLHVHMRTHIHSQYRYVHVCIYEYANTQACTHSVACGNTHGHTCIQGCMQEHMY